MEEEPETSRDAIQAALSSPPGLTVGMVRERWYVREGVKEEGIGSENGYGERARMKEEPRGVEGVTLRSWEGEPPHFCHQHFFRLPSLPLPLRALSLDSPADVNMCH
ncbi:hypothetical protein FQA47_003292 [Oryzias melastigma]|uniref:Uncharacterized protein n=1 Tax=Oryzias melastigma TaxID=30732 RepID=A0A834BWY9_ORYME|nr:hypothetical protein FQA47_003292 [Oryzias melastigma]